MIVLDTNVLSELMKGEAEASPKVYGWLARLPGDQVFTTAITVAEILGGVAILPEGKRRAGKEHAAQTVLGLFRDRILPFDLASTRYFAEAITIRRKSGKHSDGFDLLIGAIARSNDMAVATRNTDDFEDCGVQVINPWEG